MTTGSGQNGLMKDYDFEACSSPTPYGRKGFPGGHAIIGLGERQEVYGLGMLRVYQALRRTFAAEGRERIGGLVDALSRGAGCPRQEFIAETLRRLANDEIVRINPNNECSLQATLTPGSNYSTARVLKIHIDGSSHKD